MTTKAFFRIEGRHVLIQMRAEGDDGVIGDALFEVRAGGPDFFGVSFDEMFSAQSGVILIGDDLRGRRQ